MILKLKVSICLLIVFVGSSRVFKCWRCGILSCLDGNKPCRFHKRSTQSFKTEVIFSLLSPVYLFFKAGWCSEIVPQHVVSLDFCGSYFRVYDVKISLKNEKKIQVDKWKWVAVVMSLFARMIRVLDENLHLFTVNDSLLNRNHKEYHSPWIVNHFLISRHSLIFQWFLESSWSG